VNHLPAESDTGRFGGNCNWRAPTRISINGLLIRAFLEFYLYCGDNRKVDCPIVSGKRMNLFEVARGISDRLISIFLEMRLAGARSRAVATNSRLISTERITYCSTSTSTEITVQDWVPATRPGGVVLSQN
jgi:hypothetical protein